MATVNISTALQSTSSLEQVIKMINAGGTAEGIEGMEFTAADLAGQYAQSAAAGSGYPVDHAAIMAHLDLLAESGAKFDRSGAVLRGLIIEFTRRPHIAAYDDSAIWGTGATAEAAVADCTQWVNAEDAKALQASVLTAEMTPELAAEIAMHGAGSFGALKDGRIGTVEQRDEE